MYTTDIGELITFYFRFFMQEYGDEGLASIATTAVVNNYLAQPSRTTGTMVN